MVNVCDKCGTVEGCLLMIFTYDEFLMNMTVIRSHIFNHFSKSKTIFLYISSFSSQLLLVNSRVLCLLAFGFNPWNQMSTAGQKNGWFLIHICGGFLCVLSRFSCDQLLAPLWTVALHTPLSLGFSGQESWSGSPCSPPGIGPLSLPSPALVGRFFMDSATWDALQASSTPPEGSLFCYKRLVVFWTVFYLDVCFISSLISF